MGGLFVVFILILCLISNVYYYVRYVMSHMMWVDCIDFDADAEIINVHTEKESFGRRRSLTTTVKFSDGSEYISHKARGSFGMIYVDHEVRDSIIFKAVKEHAKGPFGIKNWDK